MTTDTTPDAPTPGSPTQGGRPRKAPPKWKRFLPLFGSAVMISWLLNRVSVDELLQVFREIDWQILVPFTLSLTMVAYFWDSFCFSWLFGRTDGRLAYGAVLRARGTSYLFSVINYSLGQALLSWLLARAHHIRVSAAVGRCVVMAYVDAVVLFALGLMGSSYSDDPRAEQLVPICAVGLASLLVVAAIVHLLPAHTADRIQQGKWGGIFVLLSWRLSDLVRLALLRLVYFGLGMIYLSLALRIVGMEISVSMVISALPIVALLEGLPISVAGLGTRETALIVLLRPENEPLLIGFCLIWSASVIVGRVSIGLVNLWLLGGTGAPAERLSVEP